jgi:hypothetical protein
MAHVEDSGVTPQDRQYTFDTSFEKLKTLQGRYLRLEPVKDSSNSYTVKADTTFTKFLRSLVGKHDEYVTGDKLKGMIEGARGKTPKETKHVQTLIAKELLASGEADLGKVAKRALWEDLKQKFNKNDVDYPIEKALVKYLEGKYKHRADMFNAIQEFGVNVKTGKLDVEKFSKKLAEDIVGKHNMPDSAKQKLQEGLKKQVQDLRFHEQLAHLGTGEAAPDASSLFPASSYIPIKDIKIEKIDFADDAKQAFKLVDSSKLHKPPIAAGLENINQSQFHKKPPRDLFLENANKPEADAPPPSTLVLSNAVHPALPEHLVLDKRESAEGTKFRSKDENPITNGEAVVAQTQVRFIVAESAAHIAHTHGFTMHPNGQTTTIVESLTIHPDYEKAGKKDAVMANFTRVEDTAKEGKPLPMGFQPLSAEDKKDEAKRTKYDDQLIADQIYHMTESGRIPARDKIQAHNINKADILQEQLENLLAADMSVSFIKDSFKDKFIQLEDGTIHALEPLFGMYVHQVAAEFSGLESMLPQGYVYTMDPPKIFAESFDNNAQLLTRMQFLAMQLVFKNSPPDNLKVIGFNSFNDEGATDLLKHVVPKGVAVKEKIGDDGIFKETKTKGAKGIEVSSYQYQIQDTYALVVHSNHDAFGNNLRHEKIGKSLEGTVGALTSAGVSIECNNEQCLKTGYRHHLAHKPV